MDLKILLATLMVTLAVGCVLPANAQTVVDIATCDTLGLGCGRPESPFSRKYCCVELNGRFPIHGCCNPYIGLAIGICIGVPLIAGIIVGVIVLYCCCSRYHNRKMDQLMIAYRLQQREEEEGEGGTTEEINPAAPPPYTPVAPSDSNDPDAGLPLYTESDPFGTPRSEAEGQAEPVVQANGTSQSEDREEVAGTSEPQFDDVPLLSDD